MNNLNKQISVTLKDGKEIKCECGNGNWLEVIKFFKFSGILTGQPKDSVMPVPCYICGQCGKPCQEMLPNELKETPKINVSNMVIE